MVDYNKPITAEDALLRMKNGDTKQINVLKNEITKTNQIIEDYANVFTKDIENLQKQVDGAINTYFMEGVPSLDTPPTNEWTTVEEKNNHLGDLYYDRDTGYAYRFELIDGNYLWAKIQDSDVTEALAIANSAQDTADSKRRVFVAQPTPPYDVGDLWIVNDTDLFRCRASRSEGNYESVDWIKATDYSNDDYAKGVEAVLDTFKETVETDYATKVLLETTKDTIEAEVNTVTTKVNGLDVQVTENTAKLVITDDNVTQVVEQQSEQSSKITTIEQDIDTIESKLENISDYTDSKIEFDSIHLTGTVGGVEEPHQYGYVLDFKLYGNVDWEYDYPTDDYPQNDYPINDIPQLVVSSTPKGDLSGDYMFVPLNLEEPLYAYINGGLIIRDELYIQNVDGLVVSTLTKRIERLADGTLQLLATPIVKDVGQILIPTYADNTYIYVRSINDVEYYCRWLLENDYSGVFATKAEVTNRIEVSKEGILLEVNEEITTVDNKVNTNTSSINVQAGQIEQRVSKDEVISSINQSAEAITINANKISLEGKQINLTADNTTIASNNFSVDSEGNMTANNANLDSVNIIDGTIDLLSEQNLSKLKLHTSGGSRIELSGGSIRGYSEGNVNKIVTSLSSVLGGILALRDDLLDKESLLTYNGLTITDENENRSYIDANSITTTGNVTCNDLIETSQAEKKKDFEKLEKALDIIKDIDIYKYRFKTDKENAKKHIGFVIGDDFKYSKELTNEDNTGVNAYGLASVNTKAIQELYDIIKVQQDEINKLKAIIKESD